MNSAQHVHSPSVEPLEDRLLLAAAPARIASAYLDNRGMAFFTVTVALDTSTLSRKTAAIYTAGADGQFGTADDVRNYTAVGYRKGRLSLRADIPLNQRYRVRLNAAAIKDVNGYFLDGEFNGDGRISGNARQGGSYDVIANTPVKTRARFSTVSGYINVGLYTKTVGATCVNFVKYANEGLYDNSFMHRSVLKAQQGIGVVQGGGYYVNSSNAVDAIKQYAGIATQAVNSNLKGTICMANTGQANSNTNQWYFNVTDNTNLDGGYSVFGGVLDAESQATIEAINKLPIIDARGNNQNSPFGELPVLRNTQSIQVPADLVMVTRVALLMDPIQTPGAPFAMPAVQPTAPAAATTIVPPMAVFASETLITNPILKDQA